MFAVIFEVTMPEDKQSRYGYRCGLRPLLSDAEGFISIERFASLSTRVNYCRSHYGKTKLLC